MDADFANGCEASIMGGFAFRNESGKFGMVWDKLGKALGPSPHSYKYPTMKPPPAP